MKRLLLLAFLLAAAPAAAQTLILSDNFEGATPLSTNFDQGAGNCNAVAISTTQAYSPTHGLYYTPNGHDTTGDCNHRGMPSLTKFYLSYRFWMSPTFDPCFGPGQHTFRFTNGDYGSGGRQFDTDINSGSGGACASGPIYLTLDPLFGGSEPGSGSISYIHAGTLERGAWTRVEILFDEGTSSVNGSLMVWFTDSTGVHPWPGNGGVADSQRFVSGSTTPLTWFKVVTNFDGASASDYWYADDIQIYTDCPTTGASCSTGTDTAPPTLSNGAPSGFLASGTTSTTMSVTTSEAATCKWSTSAGVSYASMTNTFTSTGSTSHSTTLTGLTDGSTFTRYVRCIDAASNANTSDYVIAFSVSAAGTLECSDWQTAHPTWLWCDDFEDDSLLTTNYWYVNRAGSNMAVMSDQFYGGAKSLRSHYTTTQPEAGDLWRHFGTNPMGTNSDNGTNFADVYWRFFVRHQSPWTDTTTDGSDKMTRATMFTGTGYQQGMIAHLWNGQSHNFWQSPVRLISGTTVLSTVYNDFAHMIYEGDVSASGTITATTDVGKWHCVETRAKLNTVGAADGIQQTWVDNVLVANDTTINFRDSYNTYGINAVFLEAYWNGNAPAAQNRWIDNFVISRDRIGCSTPAPPVVCGNGISEVGEACDDGNTTTETVCAYGQATCTACSSTCAAVLSLTGPYCGDNILNGTEPCDTAQLNSQTCATQFCRTGTLTCNINCSFNVSACGLPFRAMRRPPIGWGR